MWGFDPLQQQQQQQKRTQWDPVVMTDAQRVEAVRQLLYLDADYGYSVQLVLWPVEQTGEDGDKPVGEFTLHREDLTGEQGPASVRQLMKFLENYKQRPLISGTRSKKARPVMRANL
jgi:hypothetical protein